MSVRFALLLSLPLLLGLALGNPHPAAAQDETRSTVTVSGQGSATAEPDRAVARFGVVTRAETAEAARSENATAAKNALNAVRALDVPEENLRMETLRLQPRREYDPDTKQYEEKGFEATRQVVVQVDRLDILPRLVARVVQEGANRLEGVEYQLSDRSSIRDEALRKAARAARQKARLLATALDAQLGPVHRIDEQNFGFERPRPEMSVMMKSTRGQAEGEPEAYAAGEIEVSAQVQVVFDLVTGAEK